MKKILFVVAIGMMLAPGLAFAVDNLKTADLELMMFASEKTDVDPETKEKISLGTVMISAGKTDLVYTGDALPSGQAHDVLAQLLMKVSVIESGDESFDVEYVYSIAFLPDRWAVEGLADHDEVVSSVDLRDKQLQDLELIIPGKEQTVFQSSQLAAKGIRLFKKYGYMNLTPEFEDLFKSKIHQFVWSVNQQLPVIVAKLLEKYPEVKKNST